MKRVWLGIDGRHYILITADDRADADRKAKEWGMSNGFLLLNAADDSERLEDYPDIYDIGLV